MIKLKIYLFVTILLLCNFASAEGTHPGITTELVVRSPNDWSGGVLPSYLQDAPEIALMRFTIPPKTALPVHQHPSINAAFVMDGEITVIKEAGGERTFKKGEAIIEIVGQWHHGVNRGTTPTELIVFYATAKDMPLAVKKD